MINTKGEWIYTNAEIAYELGIAPATVNAIGKRLFGPRIAHWTIRDVELIAEYIKSISIEEDSKRLKLLHETIAKHGVENLQNGNLADRVKNDLHRVPSMEKHPETCGHSMTLNSDLADRVKNDLHRVPSMEKHPETCGHSMTLNSNRYYCKKKFGWCSRSGHCPEESAKGGHEDNNTRTEGQNKRSASERIQK